MKNLSLTFCLAIAALFGSVGSGFALPKCQGSPVLYGTSEHEMEIYKNWHNCVGFMSLPNYSFEGEYRSGVPNGQGTVTLINGDTYVGTMKNGKPNGQGIRIYDGKVKYSGQFKDGKRHGLGIITLANDIRVHGEYQNDIPDGPSLYVFPDGFAEYCAFVYEKISNRSKCSGSNIHNVLPILKKRSTF